MRLFWFGLCWMPLLAIAHEPGCSEGSGAEAIVEQRRIFNQAIVEKDPEAIASILSADVLLITGTDSDVYRGRESQVELWRQGFADPDRLIYVRTPTCIDVSSGHPIALEHGRWRGLQTDTREGIPAFSGRYTAKWRQSDGVWRLEAETYMTDCSGEDCAGDHES